MSRLLIVALLTILAISGAARADSVVHNLTATTANPAPAGSCIYVDSGPGSDTKTCANYLATLGGTAYFASPPPLGSTAPNTGAFTTLSASGAVSGAGFTALFASPPAIGGTAPAAGSFTTLSATGNLTTNITGGGVQCVHASNTGVLSGTGSDCGAGGSSAFSSLTGGTNTTAAMVVGTGASLNFSGSGTINASTLGGATFASPGAIGGTTPGAGSFTTLGATGNLTTNVTGGGTQCLQASNAGVVSGTGSACGGASGANPTATAGPVAINGSATTYMRSDAAPAVQKATGAQFGIVEVDASTITVSGGVISGQVVDSTKAADYTVCTVSTDMGNGIVLTGAHTLTFPITSTPCFGAAQSFTVNNVGSGNWTLVNNTGLTLQGLNNTSTIYPGTQGTFVVNQDGSHLDFFPGCQVATTTKLGCVEPDGTTITISGGVITAIGGSATSITVGTTTVLSGVSGDLLYNNGGVLGNETFSAACTAATGAALGCVEVDTSTITASAGVITTIGHDFYIANAGATGTTVNKLAKLTGAPSTAVITATTDPPSSTAIGIVISGAGTSGTATIQNAGIATCVFDGATVAGHAVQISTTIAGDCHDGGITPSAGQIVGTVLGTIGSAGNAPVALNIPQTAAHTIGYVDTPNTWTNAQTYTSSVTGNTQVAKSGTTYTLASTDAGTTIPFTSSSAITVTAPNSLVPGFSVVLLQQGTGVITVAAGSGATVNSATSSLVSAGQYSALSLVVEANSGGAAAVYNLYGNGTFYSAGTGIGISAGVVSSNAVEHISYQPGLLTAVNATKAVFHKFSKAATVDNIEGSAATFSCVSNPTITVYECGTSTTCASPTTIGTVTVTAAGTVVDGTVSSAAITAGDYVAFAMSAGTCASIDVSASVQVHSN